MSYQITYDPEQEKKYPKKKKTGNGAYWFCAIAMLVAIILLLVNPVVSEPVRDFLLPGDPEVTKRAITNMTEDLRAGESFSEAITTCCLEILRNGKDSDGM